MAATPSGQGARWQPGSDGAARRSWSTRYCVLRGGELAFFKDAKSRALGVPCQGEEPLGLRDARCQVAAGYKKKKHVFTLRYGPGTAPYSMGTAQHGTERVWVQHGTGMGTAQRGAAGVSPPSALTPGSATAASGSSTARMR